MPESVKLNIITVGDPGSGTGGGQNRSATYQLDNSSPNWVTINNKGDIDLTGTNSNQGQRNVQIQWVLPTAGDNQTQLTFNTINPFTVPPEYTAEFTNISVSSDGITLTVTDANDEGNFTLFEYTLNLSDSTGIDPRMVNR